MALLLSLAVLQLALAVRAQSSPGMAAPSEAPGAPCPYAPDFTAADCPLNSCYAGPPNGCGSRSLTIIAAQIVPDQWPAGVDFGPACNVHDTCYFTPGTQKDQCDNDFRAALKAECQSSLGCVNIPVVGSGCDVENPLTAVCNGLADVYYEAVKNLGQDPFNRDQEEAMNYANQCRATAGARRGRPRGIYKPSAEADCPSKAAKELLIQMVASGNVGLAFGLVAAAAAATAVGASVVFCASLAKPKFLAGSLGFAAGVMLYVSFAEIFLRKSVTSFVNADYTDIEAYRYATLAFFGGFVVVFLLDRLVHCVVHCIDTRKEKIKASQSHAALLNGEGNLSAAPPQVDIEAAAAPSRTASTALPPSPQCTSRCPPSPIVATRNVETQKEGESEEGDENPPSSPHKDTTASAANGATTMTDGTTSTREQLSIIEILEDDPHSFALHKMGVLTAIAIFLHNLPEGLATFVAALSDPSVGVGIAVAIAMHNIPEGICVALPIYYATGSKWRAFAWGTLSGLSEPLGALIGWLALYGDNSLSFAIVFALVAGMMVYISIKELLPMALRYDPKDTVATTCVVLGMAVMAASLLLFTL